MILPELLTMKVSWELPCDLHNVCTLLERGAHGEKHAPNIGI